MESLHHELSVLSKAIVYKNISTAAENIGLSQPQISRIVARLESELNVSLLDRSCRRNSTWLPTALKLSDLYKRRIRSLSSEISQIITEQEPKHLHVATLEGLVPQASEFCHQIFAKTSLEGIELNVYDLSLLEENFLRGEVDLAFTSRAPGHRKYSQCKVLGYQKLESVTSSDAYLVLSTYEQNLRSAKLHPRPADKNKKMIVSNSLQVREFWIKTFGGKGIVPSSVSKEEQLGVPVLLLGQEGFNHGLWEKIKNIDLSFLPTKGKTYEKNK